MKRNVLEYLEESMERVPDKIAFADDVQQLSFRDFGERAKRTGTYLAARGLFRKPVIVYMERTPDLVAAFFGAVYSGCCYAPIDAEMPRRRIKLILQNTQAEYMICDAKTAEDAKRLNFGGTVILYEQCQKTETDEAVLADIRRKTIDLDPVYIFYTSGSTGVPKGVVGHHRGIINYIEQLSEALGFDESFVFANQTPLFWDASMKEIFATLKCGATTWITPIELFLFPVKLVEYLNERRINAINWVASALTMVSAFGTFDVVKPEYLKLVTFCGEVFPAKQFNIWKRELPEARFYNLYGPTEATGVSTYYCADRLFEENEAIPIGKAFANTEILLLDGQGNEVPEGETGEMCIRGSGVTLGYFGALERAGEVFTQNPANPYYFDPIYHTGDMARRNDQGDLVFAGRRDHQIKHMGHRIELGEIDAELNAIDNVNAGCCIYVKEREKLVIYYVGDIEKGALVGKLKERLPRYMLPNAVVPLDKMPLTVSGKMDRMELQRMYMENVAKKRNRKKENRQQVD